MSTKADDRVAQCNQGIAYRIAQLQNGIIDFELAVICIAYWSREIERESEREKPCPNP